jgi:hypothetical protein
VFNLQRFKVVVQQEVDAENISLDKIVSASAVKKTQQNLSELYTDAA